MPSTNSRSPNSVGMRPAEVCGLASSPISSRSCMTLRIDAADKPSPDILEIVRDPTGRSEEHTSELQSLMRISYAVFCLKKKHEIPQTTTIHLVYIVQTLITPEQHIC